MNDNNRPQIITHINVFEVSLYATPEGPRFGIGGTCTIEDASAENCNETTNPPKTPK